MFEHDSSAIMQEWPQNASRWSAARIRLPFRATGDSEGLGDLISAITTSVGIAPCAACERRAARLNRLVSLPVFRRVVREKPAKVRRRVS